MTERTDPYLEHLEKERYLKEWRAQKKAEKEAAERQQKRAGLEAHLKRRADEWIATTGSTDGLNEELPRWRAAYLDAREAEAQAEREARLAKSIEQNYRF